MAWAGIFHQSSHPDMLWDPNNLVSNGYQKQFLHGQSTWTMSWSLMSN